ncbi:MAG: EAL domain-containing protein [Alphaproteobacteria bacterium]|nr:EAL domain-containing protein [Alphaproteobacteria bacterium]
MRIDAAGKIVAATEDVASLFGYEDTEMISKNINELLPYNESQVQRLIPTNTTGANGHNITTGVHEFKAKKKDGTEFQAEVFCSDSSGPFASIFIFNAMYQDFYKKVEGAIHVILRRALRGEDITEFAPYICERLCNIFILPYIQMLIRNEDNADIVNLVASSGDVSGGEGGANSGGVSDKLYDWMKKKAEDVVQSVRPCKAKIDKKLLNGIEINNPVVVSIPITAKLSVLGVLQIICDDTMITDSVMGWFEAFGKRIGLAVHVSRDQKKLKLQSAAMTSVSSAICLTDVSGAVEWVNPAFSRISGYEVEEMLGNNLNVLGSGTQSQQSFAEMWDSILSGDVWRGEIVNKSKDGHLYTVDQTITPLRDAKNKITHFVAVQDDITAHKDAEGMIKNLSNYDQLTGLPNRQQFLERLETLIEECRANNEKAAIMFIDFINFNRINDTLGHAIGDALLNIMSERICSVVSNDAIVARMGGDTFAVACKGMENAEQVSAVAMDIIGKIWRTTTIHDNDVNVGSCIGISMFPKDSEHVEKLVNYADMAMCRAVETTKNSYHFYSHEMSSDNENRLSLERDMHKALINEEFLLYYQPQFDLRAGSIIGWEALVRWKHPTRGMIPPGVFIPVAEDSGLITPLGDWVLEEALKQLVRWNDEGLEKMTVAVNLSAAQFQQDDLAHAIKHKLAKYDIPPNFLELELTESVIMNDAKASQTLKQLSDIGIQIAIDDFGTGYSSLNYLKRFPVDRLKIDQSFVREMTVDYDDAEIARAIINLGHGLGLEVVSEGVETEEQLEMLFEQGCDVIQGFLLGKPMPPDMIPGYLRSMHFQRDLLKNDDSEKDE